MHEVVCRAGPSDRPFEERHEGFSVSAVIEGSFTYRSDAGHGLLYPGALLLGNDGWCFECGHAHGIGDRCISLNVREEQFGEIAATAAATSRFRFSAPSLPPSPKALPVIARGWRLCPRPDLRRAARNWRCGSSSASSPRWPAIGPSRPRRRGREAKRVVEAIRLGRGRRGAADCAQGDGGDRGHEQISLPARLPPADGHDAASISHQRPAAPRRAGACVFPPAGHRGCARRPASATFPLSTKPFAPHSA